MAPLVVSDHPYCSDMGRMATLMAALQNKCNGKHTHRLQQVPMHQVPGEIAAHSQLLKAGHWLWYYTSK